MSYEPICLPTVATRWMVFYEGFPLKIKALRVIKDASTSSGQHYGEQYWRFADGSKLVLNESGRMLASTLT